MLYNNPLASNVFFPQTDLHLLPSTSKIHPLKNTIYNNKHINFYNYKVLPVLDFQPCSTVITDFKNQNFGTIVSFFQELENGLSSPTVVRFALKL